MPPTQFHLLLEHVDLGDRVRGVFSSPLLANAAAKAIVRQDLERLGAVPHDYLARFHVATFELDQVDYP